LPQAGAKNTVRKVAKTSTDFAERAVRRDGHAARVDRSRAVILDAAAAMITERGPAAFSIDAVVAGTGVAKTTVYRHWPTRRDLMVAAFNHMAHPGGVPDTGSLRGDLRTFFMGSVAAMNDRWDKHLQTLPGIIEATQRDPDLAEVGIQMLDNTARALLPMLQRAQSRGELRKDVSLEAMSHILLGATFMHRALDCALSENYILEVINSVLDGITAAPRRTTRRSVSRGRSRPRPASPQR
jgi:AcrR family transcriptional regulator